MEMVTLDIGGTEMKSALFNHDGKIIEQESKLQYQLQNYSYQFLVLH